MLSPDHTFPEVSLLANTFTVGVGLSLSEGSRNSQLHFNAKDDVIRALPVYVPWCKKNDPPQHPPALRPMRNKPSANEKSQLYSSTSQSRIKTTSCTNESLNGGKHTQQNHKVLTFHQ